LFTIIGLEDNDDEKLTSFQKLVHWMGEYSKLDRIKMMGTRGKINEI